MGKFVLDAAFAINLPLLIALRLFGVYFAVNEDSNVFINFMVYFTLELLIISVSMHTSLKSSQHFEFDNSVSKQNNTLTQYS